MAAKLQPRKKNSKTNIPRRKAVSKHVIIYTEGCKKIPLLWTTIKRKKKNTQKNDFKSVLMKSWEPYKKVEDFSPLWFQGCKQISYNHCYCVNIL